MKKIVAFCLFLSLMFFSVRAQVTVRIDSRVRHQTITQIGASDAWGTPVAGMWESRNKVAQLLFSTGFDGSGNPEGIGLSLWRVNLGAGTENSDIMPVQRRMPSFVGEDGTYNWNNCQGQRYFMSQAREYGCNNFIFFSNSPLTCFTLNGKGYSSSACAANIRPDCYGKYAVYLRDVALHFIGDGYHISGISPINEPSGKWNTPSQEGTPWRISEMKKMFQALDEALGESPATDAVGIVVGESARVSTAYGFSHTGSVRRQFGTDDAPEALIPRFFCPDSASYIGNLKHVRPQFYAHCYHENRTVEKMISTRRNMAETCLKYGIEYHQSEWCMLPEYFHRGVEGLSEPYYAGAGNTMEIALLMARMIWTDFTIGNAVEWSYWKAVEIGGNHSLIGIYPFTENFRDGGGVLPSKLLWTLGNYSRFIRPGYQRIECSGAEEPLGLVASAFVSPDGRSIVVVFVNSSDKETVARVKFEDGKYRFLRAYSTSSRTDLTLMPESSLVGKSSLKIPAASVCSAVFSL